jgi:hypothetical protein
MADLKRHPTGHPEVAQPPSADARQHILIEGNSTLAVYRDPSGGRVVLKGRGFQFDEGAATGGIVTGATFIDKLGATYLAWEA